MTVLRIASAHGHLGKVSTAESLARAERMKQRLERPLLLAALLAIPAVALEASNIGHPWDTLATVLNWTVWTAFLAEAILMLAVVDNPWRWIRNPADDQAAELGRARSAPTMTRSVDRINTSAERCCASSAGPRSALPLKRATTRARRPGEILSCRTLTAEHFEVEMPAVARSATLF